MDARLDVEHAIGESIASDRIITLDDAPGLAAALLAECDDYASTGRIVEYWGERDGRPWRVHVRVLPVYEPTSAFIVPPECQGQGVEYAYALDARACVIVERRTDRSEPIASRVTFHAFEYPAGDPGEWEPQNGRPVLGEPIGRCKIRGPD